MQSNGIADDVAYINFCSGDAAQLSSLQLVQFSSDEEVLSVSRGDNQDALIVRVSSGYSCLNLTISFSFDRFVANVQYTLVAQNAANEQVCNVSISFIVAGLKIYRESTVQSSARVSVRKDVPSNENPAITKTIVSGTENDITSNYEAVISSPVEILLVKVHYPDGTDSNEKPVADVVSSLRTLAMETQTEATPPIFSDNSQCLIFGFSAETSDDHSNCGALFLVEEPSACRSEISLAPRFRPYRDGSIELTFTWPSLTEEDEDFAEEEYTNMLPVNIVGSSWRVLRVGNDIFREVDGLYQQREDGLYSTTFLSQLGSGTNLNWHINVAFPDGTSSTAKIVSNQVFDLLSYNDE